MGGGQFAFDLLDTAFNKALAVFGCVVFRVLAQIALGACFGNRIDHRGTLNGLEFVQLVFEFFSTAFGNWNSRHQFLSYALSCACMSWTEITPKLSMYFIPSTAASAPAMVVKVVTRFSNAEVRM